MRTVDLCAIGLFFLFSGAASAHTNKIRIDYVDNGNGQYNECGKRLALKASKEKRHILAFANDITEMNIDRKVVYLELVSSSEKTVGATTKGEGFEEFCRTGKTRITIRYIVKGYSDNAVWYRGRLTVKTGN